MVIICSGMLGQSLRHILPDDDTQLYLFVAATVAVCLLLVRLLKQRLHHYV